ncbi:ATP-dependent DNA helicase RecG [Geothermobacter hydrogeniphilus]|uniref:ATP-dependent DNA helicase RecG n=1 Tax=Geothermobacter hydrogeniphilus TaxID=1969733 RepID=A0A1X0YES2_9BACT|nr:ATP-dependent DNA helicase RecG [Geothermobacter hydrogeniphilus]
MIRKTEDSSFPEGLSLQNQPANLRAMLQTPVTALAGVGPKLAEKLGKIGLETVEDLLYTLPNRYEDRREFRRIGRLREGRYEVFGGEILYSGETTTRKGRRKLFEVVVGDGSGTISLKWFHYRRQWQEKQFKVGRKAVFGGEVKRFGAVREVHHPEVDFLPAGGSFEAYRAADPLVFGRILPVYPLTEGLHQKTARKIWKEAVDRYAPAVRSVLPQEILQRRGLQPLNEALVAAHWPADDVHYESLGSVNDPARRSLVFDEFFFLELGLALKRKGMSLEPGIPFQVEHRYTRPLARMLPYRLTAAQRRVLGEIKHDLMRPHPMNRLLQGDVGSGKTIVALMAALVAIENHTQVAIVAPTEILAEQHYRQFSFWLEKLGLRAALLSGGLKGRPRQELLEQLAAGEVHLVVGTHAVLQEDVTFRCLGLGIIDEQHRFGVEQRQVLRRKGMHPHILVMTATPIPRTMALAVFGDLDLSVIDELPPGRTPIETRLVADRGRNELYRFMRGQLQQGRQGYIVYPLVEESEKSDLQAATEAAEQLRSSIFPEFSIAVLHGRMKSDEKDAVMQRFKAGEIQLLVSTTVIEVGIDVPNATMMVVEHAERFGLAQLHQLRGRVGRGAGQSYCFLLRSQRCSEDGLKRLQVMCDTNDGFRIAEADLEIRGPGDFLGTRQAGLPDFRIANLLQDGRVLEEARQEAMAMVEDPEFPSADKYREIIATLHDRWGGRLELASIG